MKMFTVGVEKSLRKDPKTGVSNRPNERKSSFWNRKKTSSWMFLFKIWFFRLKTRVTSVKFERKSFLTPFHTSDIDKNEQKEYTVECRNLTRWTKTFINWVFLGVKTRFLEGRRWTFQSWISDWINIQRIWSILNNHTYLWIFVENPYITTERGHIHDRN